jgi:hypothetical protein
MQTVLNKNSKKVMGTALVDLSETKLQNVCVRNFAKVLNWVFVNVSFLNE